MEIQNILMLIQAFTEHSLTELNVEDGGVKVCLKREAPVSGAVVSASTAAMPITVSGGMTAGLAETGTAAVVSESGNPVTGGLAAAGLTPGNPVPGGAAGLAAGIPVSGTAADLAAGVPVSGTGAGSAAGIPVSGTGAGSAAGILVSGTAAGPAPGISMPGIGAGVNAVAGMGVAAQAVPSVAAGVVSVATQTSVPVQPAIDSGNVVVSPLVGIFYSASSPEAEPFVKVGDQVKKGQVLGIIEAMKLMNEIESEYDGVVEAILVKNEDMVEYGQPLFRIR